MQPGQIAKSYTGVQLSGENDVPVVSTTTTSGYRFMYNGSQFCLAEYDRSRNRSELNLWNNDGTAVSNVSLNRDYVLDVTYDSTEESYYAIRWVGDQLATGFTFSEQTEGGVESAAGLLVDDFSAAAAWQASSIPYIQVINGVSFRRDKPVYVAREKRRWVDYAENYYTGSVASAGVLWGNTASYVVSTPSSNATNLLNVDTENSQLTYFTKEAPAIMTVDVTFSGDLLTYIDLDVTSLEADCIFGLRVLGDIANTKGSFNQLGSICYRGDDSSPYVQAWTVLYDSDSSSDAWGICNTRISEVYLTTSAGGASSIASGTTETYKIAINAYNYLTETSEYLGSLVVKEHALEFTVVDSAEYSYGKGIIGTNVSLDTVDYSEGEWCYGDMHRSFSWVGEAAQVLNFDAAVGFEFDPNTGALVNPVNSGVLHSSIDVTVGLLQEAAGVDNGKVRLAIRREGSVLTFLKRDNTVAGGAYTEVHSFDSGYTGELKFEFIADATLSVAPPDVVCTGIVVRGLFPSEQPTPYVIPAALWHHSLLALEVFDIDGTEDDTAVTAGDGGRVISLLDLIQEGVDFGGSFESVYGSVQICTNHGIGSAGEIFIAIGQDVYKYLKSVLPIADLETGALASVSSIDALDATVRSNTLCWNGHTQAGLVYIAGNTADPGEGLFVNCLRHTTATANSPLKFSWIESSDTTFDFYGTDPRNPSVLYGYSTSDRKVYMYNLGETVSAFCNVVSVKQILGANTSETSVITAQVLSAFGDPLMGKTVNFSVSSGDGAVSPSSDATDAFGEASTTYTVGATVGTSTVRATVAD